MLTIKTHLKSLVTSSLYLSNVGTLVAAKHPLKGADGVVVSSYRLFIPNGFDKRWLETATPSAPAKERGHFFMAQPPLLREEGDYARPTSSTGPNALGYILSRLRR